MTSMLTDVELSRVDPLGFVGGLLGLILDFVISQCP